MSGTNEIAGGIFTIPKDKKFTVKIEYSIDKDGSLMVVNDVNRKSFKAEDIKVATATFLIPNWKEVNDLNEASMVPANNGASDTVFSFGRYKENILKKLLIDLKDGDNVTIDTTDEFIDSMDPRFAQSILNAYFMKMRSEEEA